MKTISILVATLLLAACQTLPTSSEWLARGDGYAKDGNLPKAIEAYNRAATLNPERADIYAARGAAYFSQGNYFLAQQDFFKTLQLNPYTIDAYTALATTLAVQGEYENAMEVINRVLVLAGQKPEVFFTRGGINFMLGNYDQAVHDYTFVLNMRPAADVYQARAAAYQKLNKPDLAKADQQEAASGKYLKNLTDYQLIK